MWSELDDNETERDLVASVKMSTQCAAVTKKANSMLGMVRKGIAN